MHEMHTYNPHVYSAISAHIKSLLNVNPGIAAQPSVPLPVNIAPAPVGQRGDSN
jgi:phage tail protein X